LTADTAAETDVFTPLFRCCLLTDKFSYQAENQPESRAKTQTITASREFESARSTSQFAPAVHRGGSIFNRRPWASFASTAMIPLKEATHGPSTNPLLRGCCRKLSIPFETDDEQHLAARVDFHWDVAPVAAGADPHRFR
jgi:hypothetical protein